MLVNRALLRLALLPRLVATQETGDRRHRRLAIRNGGGGLAIAVQFYWVCDGRHATGLAATYLANGEGVRVYAALSPDDMKDGYAVITCEDVRGNQFAWSLDERSRIRWQRPWRGKRNKRLDPQDCFSTLYPDIVIDGLEQAEYSAPGPMSAGIPSGALPKTVAPDVSTSS